MTKAQTSPSRAVNGHGAASACRCRACLKSLPPGSGCRYCSGKCRLRGWAVRELAKALDGRLAEGLREDICQLGRRAK